jgi:V8-like Glu-specific endopeptidase
MSMQGCTRTQPRCPRAIQNVVSMTIMTSMTIMIAAIASFTETARAQFAPMESYDVAVSLNSGTVIAPTFGRAAVFGDLVYVPDAAWIRLAFADVRLGAAPHDGLPTLLRVTSLQDGATQLLDANALEQWSNTSAYFNGNAVLIEIVADPAAEASHLTIDHATFGPTLPHVDFSLCGGIDDRTLSDDPRIGRIAPGGCTAWLIDDEQRTFLTAGHCALNNGDDVVQFNVPLSTGSGQWNHPAPSDQYIVDPASVQSNGGQGVGKDWAYFGCFPNAVTGLTAAQAQGAWFQRAPVGVDNSTTVRITGYGTTTLPAPREWNQVQKTHDGPLEVDNPATSTLKYTVDTTGGNSGSPVIDAMTELAIGIHTHGGCPSTGVNAGTRLDHPDLLDALANPLGVCAGLTPANDACAMSLPAANDAVPFSTVGAATSEAATGCGAFAGDVWFHRDIPTAGRLYVSICDATFSAIIGLYDETCPSPETAPTACATDGCATGALASLDVEPSRVQIRIGGADGTQGAGTMQIAFVPSCPGDCAPQHDDGTYGNGKITLDDLVLVLNHWGGAFDAGDAHPQHAMSIGNGEINIEDVVALLNTFGPCATP